MSLIFVTYNDDDLAKVEKLTQKTASFGSHLLLLSSMLNLSINTILNFKSCHVEMLWISP